MESSQLKNGRFSHEVKKCVVNISPLGGARGPCIQFDHTIRTKSLHVSHIVFKLMYTLCCMFIGIQPKFNPIQFIVINKCISTCERNEGKMSRVIKLFMKISECQCHYVVQLI